MAIIGYDTDSSTLIINGRTIDDFIAGTFISISKPNPDTSRVNGAKGSLSVAKRTDRDVTNVEIHILKGSDSDKYLNPLATSEAVNIVDGSVVSRFSKNGSYRNERWTLSGGTVTTQPTFDHNNTDHAAEATYQLEFRKGVRDL